MFPTLCLFPQYRICYSISCLFMHLYAMYSQARSCVQLLMTYMALKMFCFWVLYQDLFIIKISITKLAPLLQLLLLLLVTIPELYWQSKKGRGGISRKREVKITYSLDPVATTSPTGNRHKMADLLNPCLWSCGKTYYATCPSRNNLEVMSELFPQDKQLLSRLGMPPLPHPQLQSSGDK